MSHTLDPLASFQHEQSLYLREMAQVPRVEVEYDDDEQEKMREFVRRWLGRSNGPATTRR